MDRCLHLFEKESGDEIEEIEQDGIVTSCDFSQNGLYYACTVDISNECLVYDTRNHEIVQRIKLESTPTSVEFSPNSGYGNTVGLYSHYITVVLYSKK